jgi:hypothetical protein
MNGIEDRGLDLTQRLCRAHSPSLRWTVRRGRRESHGRDTRPDRYPRLA